MQLSTTHLTKKKKKHKRTTKFINKITPQFIISKSERDPQNYKLFLLHPINPSQLFINRKRKTMKSVEILELKLSSKHLKEKQTQITPRFIISKSEKEREREREREIHKITSSYYTNSRRQSYKTGEMMFNNKIYTTLYNLLARAHLWLLWKIMSVG